MQALLQSNSNIQMSTAVPRNGAITRHHNNIEQGVQTYQRIVMKNGQPVETEEVRFYSTD